jgi:acyl-CoA thioester hydrolase
MYIHETDIRVRYGETDQMGYLYYGNYALYYEVGRAEAMRALGITYREQEAEIGVMMPVMYLQSRYLRPAKYDELVRVRSEVRQLPTDQMRFFHEIRNEEGKLLNAGEVKLAFVDRQTGKRCQAPDYLLDKLAPFWK